MTRQSWQLSPDQVEHLGLGARLLGSGGAGRTYEIELATRAVLEVTGPITVEPLSGLRESDEVVAVGLVGSVIAYSEKPASAGPYVSAYKAIRTATSPEDACVCTYEIAGVNAFAGVLVAASANIRLVDVDGMGRAYPGLHQTSFNVGGVPMTPCSIVSSSGTRIDIHHHSAEDAETVLRTFMPAAGGWAAFAGYAMDGRQAQTAGIPATMHRAVGLGRKLLRSLRQSANPRDGIEDFCARAEGATFIDHGRVVEVSWRSAHDKHHVERRVGSIVIRSHNGRRHLRIEAQSEHLLLMEDGVLLSCSPEIIDLLDSRTGAPIPAEEVVPGFAVSLITVTGPEVWNTTAGREITKLRAMGYRIPQDEV